MSFSHSLFLTVFIFTFSFIGTAQTPVPSPTAPNSPAIEKFAAELLAAETDPKREILINENKPLLTAELRQTLITSGDALRVKSKFDDALAAFRTARLVAERLNDADGVAEALSRQGAVYRFKGEYERAMEFLEPALRHYETTNNDLGVGMVLNNVGAVSYFRGDYGRAEEIWRRALAAREKTGVQKDINQSLNNLGALYSATGKIDDALEVFRRLVVSSRQLKDDYALAAALNNVGDILAERGDYRAAMEYLLEALEINERRGDKLDVSLVLNNLGQVYYSQANYERAALYYERARRLREEVGDQQGLAVTLMHLGMVRAANDEYAAATDLVKESLALREKIGDKRGIAVALNNLGRIELRAGRTGTALEFFNRSLAQYETSQYKDGIAQTLNSVARARLDLGDAAAAAEAAARAVALARETGARETLSLALSILGQARAALGQTEIAEKTLRESVEIIETVRTQVTGDALDRQQFFQDRTEPYHKLVEMLARAGKIQEAMQFAERAKGRVLLDVMQSGANALLVKNANEKERAEEANLESRIVIAENNLRRQAAKPNADRAALADLQTKLDKERAALDAFNAALYAAHPELKLQRGEAKIVSTDELNALLPNAESALAEYVVTEKQTYLFVATKGKTAVDLRVYPLDLSRRDLNQSVTNFRNALARRDIRFNAEAAKLYQKLIQPAAAQINGKSRLTIVPDGALWELPFQALVSADSKYVVENHAVSYAPSFSVLAALERESKGRKTSASGDLLAFGNPSLRKSRVAETSTEKKSSDAVLMNEFADLPEAEKQVKALSALYQTKRSRVLIGELAGETEFKREAANYRIIHLATHGVLDDSSPLYSYVLLSGGAGGDDGMLQAWELMQMNLNADFVVLSACETARGAVRSGEGIIGLSWALFVAGTPTTVASQWKVESASTTALMLGFYKNLQTAKTTKAEALRRASLALLKNEKYSHPFYWAGFVIVGDGE